MTKKYLDRIKDLLARLQKKEDTYIRAKARGVKTVRDLTAFERKKKDEYKLIINRSTIELLGKWRKRKK